VQRIAQEQLDLHLRGFELIGEAQQAGTPVVASTAGSIPQIAGAAALLSPARDVEALAANLHWIVTNDELHAKLVRRGSANVARFSWASTAANYHAMYEELAQVCTGFRAALLHGRMKGDE
jgi:glycosyltransferase involved in cell wall biosynthesis